MHHLIVNQGDGEQLVDRYGAMQAVSKQIHWWIKKNSLSMHGSRATPVSWSNQESRSGPWNGFNECTSQVIDHGLVARVCSAFSEDHDREPRSTHQQRSCEKLL